MMVSRMNRLRVRRRTETRWGGGALVVMAGACLAAPAAQAVCVPFPCIGCDVSGAAQVTFVRYDRAAGEIHLVPNVRLEGEGDHLALVVPTPSVPTFEQASLALWSEADAVTAPFRQRAGSSGGLACNAVSVEHTVDAVSGTSILSSQIVGAFEVTVIGVDTPSSLVEWLDAEGFEVNADDSTAFAPYVDRGWVFTAMRSVEPLPATWVRSVDPVRITFAATEFEVPLPLLAINRANRMRMVFYVVDRHRLRLPGYDTVYANRLSASELDAIAERRPTLVQELREHWWLTRLERTYGPDDDLSEPATMDAVLDPTEVVTVVPLRAGGVDPALIVLVLVAGGAGLQSLRRRRRAG